MSEAEMQIEEESLQLTPEDIQLLSEYSWDLTGYTSRFGYFYLGSGMRRFPKKLHACRMRKRN